MHRPHRLAQCQRERLRHKRHNGRADARRDDRWTNRCQRAADGRPVQEGRDLGDRERHESDSPRFGRNGFRRPKHEGDTDQDCREAGVEAKELHARLARDPGERDDDADAEVRKKQEEDHEGNC